MSDGVVSSTHGVFAESSGTPAQPVRVQRECSRGDLSPFLDAQGVEACTPGRSMQRASGSIYPIMV
jgi:hypothetical protein